MQPHDREKTGVIFDIERFATKDGPGIRTVVFLKGCHLHCRWCQNPESQHTNVEVMYDAKKCTACGRCLESCPNGAIQTDASFGLVSDSETCIGCGLCTETCYYDARKLVGTNYKISALMKEILKDKLFYENSGGGVTFSGGEPLLQSDFLMAVCRACGREKVHRAVETCGHVPWNVFNKLLSELDLIFFDLKHIDPGLHKQYTGVTNELILDNLRKLSDVFSPLIVRIPVIPGFNDASETQKSIFSFLKNQLKRITTVELLPFHRLGSSKYKGLGREYPMENIVSLKKEDLKHLEKLGRDMGIPVRVGAI
jgi:pyruvate formate lyase activating enzyme